MTDLKTLVNIRTGNKGYVTKLINKHVPGSADDQCIKDILVEKKSVIAETTNAILVHLKDDDQKVVDEIMKHNEFEEVIMTFLARLTVSTVEPVVTGHKNRVELPKLHMKKILEG